MQNKQHNILKKNSILQDDFKALNEKLQQDFKALNEKLQQDLKALNEKLSFNEGVLSAIRGSIYHILERISKLECLLKTRSH